MVKTARLIKLQHRRCRLWQFPQYIGQSLHPISAKALDLAMALDSTPQFALARPDRPGQSAGARLGGKLSRLLARQVVTKRLPIGHTKPLVTFTFDDAPASACSTGAALLEQYQARGTYYVCGGGCGTMSPNGRLGTTEQVKALYAKGHEIGCHTFSHAAVAGIGHDALVAELERNRSFLQGIDRGMIVRNFAYPYGDLSFRTKRHLERHFDSCRSLHPGVNIASADLGALKARALENASIDRRGISAIVAETARRSGWLVFNSHDVNDEPSQFGVSPALLEFALKAVREAGCRVVTVREALQILRVMQ
jgi:peptidoglycan/xylan/chitin deacetylase (PgdA/CDA1 family)